MTPRVLSLEEFGFFSPRLIYGLAVAGGPLQEPIWSLARYRRRVSGKNLCKIVAGGRVELPTKGL